MVNGEFELIDSFLIRRLYLFRRYGMYLTGWGFFTFTVTITTNQLHIQYRNDIPFTKKECPDFLLNTRNSEFKIL